jgi:hypothetical protein
VRNPLTRENHSTSANGTQQFVFGVDGKAQREENHNKEKDDVCLLFLAFPWFCYCANLSLGRMEDAIVIPTIQLYLKNTTGKGRGVFNAEFIPKNSLIHISPVLVFRGQDTELSQKTILSHYTYNWGTNQAVALGLGSMFNHSKTNNVGFIKRKDKEVIEYYTIQDVQPDTELCINYGPHLWFYDADGPEVQGDEVPEEEINFLAIGLDL